MKEKQFQQSPSLKSQKKEENQKKQDQLKDEVENFNQIQSFQQQDEGQQEQNQYDEEDNYIDDISAMNVNKSKRQNQQQQSYQSETNFNKNKKVKKKNKKQSQKPSNSRNRNKLCLFAAFLIACIIIAFLGYHIYKLKLKSTRLPTFQQEKKQLILQSKKQNMKLNESTQTNNHRENQSKLDQMIFNKSDKVQNENVDKITQKIDKSNESLLIQNTTILVQKQKNQESSIIQVNQQIKQIIKQVEQNQNIKPLNNFCIIMNKKEISEDQEHFKSVIKQLMMFSKQKEMERMKLMSEQQKQQSLLQIQKNRNQWTSKLIAFQQYSLIQKYENQVEKIEQNSSEILKTLKQRIQEKKNDNLEEYAQNMEIISKVGQTTNKIETKILKTFHNKGENTYNAIHNHCHNDDIAIILNEGDQFVNYEALKTINEHFSDKSTYMAAAHLIDHEGNEQKPQNYITSYKRVNLYVDKRSQTEMKAPISIIRFTRFFRVSYYKKLFHTKLMNYKLQFLNSTLSFLLPLSQNFQFWTNSPAHLSQFFSIPSKFTIIQKAIIKQTQPFKNLITQEQLEEIRQIQDKANLQNVNETYLNKSYTLNLTNFHLQTERKIPKKIHQVQIGKRPLTQFYKYLRSQIEHYMGDYEYKLWTEEDLTRQNFPHTYDYTQKLLQIDKTFQFSRLSMVVDLMKIEVIYQNGGIYLDKNVQLFKSLDHLTNFRLFSGRQDHSANNYVSVGVFGAQKHSPLLGKLLTEESLSRINLRSISPQEASGPWYFGKAIQLQDYYTGDLFVLDQQSMYPYQKWKSSQKIKNCACAVQSNQAQRYWPQHMKDANIKFEFVQQKGYKIIKNCPFYKYAYSIDYFMFGGTWKIRRSRPNNFNNAKN